MSGKLRHLFGVISTAQCVFCLTGRSGGEKIAMTNLQYLQSRDESLTAAERAALECYIVGAVSLYVDPIVWRRIVEQGIARVTAAAKEK